MKAIPVAHLDTDPSVIARQIARKGAGIAVYATAWSGGLRRPNSSALLAVETIAEVHWLFHAGSTQAHVHSDRSTSSHFQIHE
jgi:hypothetical protein